MAAFDRRAVLRAAALAGVERLRGPLLSTADSESDSEAGPPAAVCPGCARCRGGERGPVSTGSGAGAFEAVVWAETAVEKQFVTWAVEALRAAGEQLALSVSVTVASRDHGRLIVESPADRPATLEDARTALQGTVPERVDVANDQHHFLVVDQFHGQSGQGYTWGTVGGSAGPWPRPDSSAISCVNTAAKRWAELSLCYGGMGRAAFKASVLHNLGHGLLPRGDHHQFGEIRDTGLFRRDVSPMQLGYVDANCSGNPPVETNCSGNPAAFVTGVTTEYSACTRQQINRTNQL